MNLNLKQLNTMRLRADFKRKLFFNNTNQDIIEVIKTEETIEEMETNVNSLGNNNPVSIMLDTLKIVESIKDEYKNANEIDRQRFIKFFFYGMFFMFSSMVMSLWALGFIDALFYAKFIGGTMCSLAFAFTVGKIKEVIPVLTDNYESMKKLLNKIVVKLSKK